MYSFFLIPSFYILECIKIYSIHPNKTCMLYGCTAAFFKLPYRLIFAVATLNSLYIYDTESIEPIAVLAGVHYASITDIAWYLKLTLFIVCNLLFYINPDIRLLICSFNFLI